MVNPSWEDFSSIGMTKDQQTEERILEAAQRVFVRRGMSGARTQEIADEAGVNRALINYYFRSKDKLADAVFLRVARSLFPALMRTLASDLPFREKLQATIDLEFDTLAKHPFLPLYVLAELQYHPERLQAFLNQSLPLNQMRTVVLSKLQQQLDAEAEAGRLRPSRAEDVLVTLISLMIFPFAASSMIETVLGFSQEDQEVMRERRRADLADFVLRGLRP